MSVPDDLPQRFKDCLSGKSCGGCSYLKCETFLAGRRLHLENKMKQACDSLLNWRSYPEDVQADKRREVNEIPLAMRRISDGNYGRCGNCGDSIAKERLEHLPEAARCAPCQTRLDNRATAK